MTVVPDQRQLVGEFAQAVQDRLRTRLADERPDYRWVTEYDVDGTPVDVAGLGADLVAVELEWRRADPADNTAKLFRHLEAGMLDEYDQVTVVQVFTGYYDLASGGVSSKRENAEFVGRVAERALPRVSYCVVAFDLDPPKQGGTWPEEWRAVADETVTEIVERL